MHETSTGVIFPTKDIGANSAALLEFAPAAEELGLDFITTYDHIVGIRPEAQDPESITNCNFTHETNVHESIVLLSAMAALTNRIRLVTGCLVSPQRQTALVAKQAAELDIISNGRLDLGISNGWNEPEFRAMGASFEDRSMRLEHQVTVLRNFWSHNGNVIDDGSGHPIELSILPRPIQSPIPIWIGGMSMRVARRAARVADGWLPLGYFDHTMLEKTELFWERAELHSRIDLKLMGRMNPWRDSTADCIDQYGQWVDAGATHVAIGTSEGCYKNTKQYFSELSDFTSELQRQTA